MRFSLMYSPTLKEDPSGSELASYSLMIRASLIKKLVSGVYTILPLGQRIFSKVMAIIREEMHDISAQELSMPVLLPASLWKKSGRWDKYGDELFRLSDRHDNDFCLGPTHEEVVLSVVQQGLRSYRDFPLTLYQIQTKFRDEVRPRFGMMRCREFLMKDAYSFHASYESLDETYNHFIEAYHRICRRFSLNVKMVAADNGTIGGASSAEFMVLTDTGVGEDSFVRCSLCSYAANMEAADWRLIFSSKYKEKNYPKYSAVFTPGCKAIADLNVFLKDKNHSHLVKTMVYVIKNELTLRFILVLIAQDREVNEFFLKRKFGEELTLATDEQIKVLLGSEPGYVGPVGLEAHILMDTSVEHLDKIFVGSNRLDYHFDGVISGRDFIPNEVLCCSFARQGDRCCYCDDGELLLNKGIEVGHVFKLGTVYSSKMTMNFLNENGVSQAPIMGCYGLGVGRIVASIVESHHDVKGIRWPMSIAPFQCVLIITNIKDDTLRVDGERLYEELQSWGMDVLYDDRKMNVGVKFKDADLIGIPVHIIIGKAWLRDNLLEIYFRLADRREIISKDMLTKEYILMEQ